MTKEHDECFVGCAQDRKGLGTPDECTYNIHSDINRPRIVSALQGPAFAVRTVNASKATKSRVLSHFLLLEADIPSDLIENGMTVQLEEEFRAPAFVSKLVLQFYPGRETIEEWIIEHKRGQARNPTPPLTTSKPAAGEDDSPSIRTVDEDGNSIQGNTEDLDDLMVAAFAEARAPPLPLCPLCNAMRGTQGRGRAQAVYMGDGSPVRLRIHIDSSLSSFPPHRGESSLAARCCPYQVVHQDIQGEVE